jgi:hypothetical protein
MFKCKCSSQSQIKRIHCSLSVNIIHKSGDNCTYFHEIFTNSLYVPRFTGNTVESSISISTGRVSLLVFASGHVLYLLYNVSDIFVV